MKHFIIFIILAAFSYGCSKKEEVSLKNNDSILSKPTTENIPEAQASRDTTSGLVIDQSRFYTPDQQELLHHFGPQQIVSIYHDFKVIRKPGITQAQIDAYIKSKKITLDELKAILQEGDRRGWNK